MLKKNGEKNKPKSIMYQKKQKMQNEPNLNIFLISSAAACPDLAFSPEQRRRGAPRVERAL